MGKRNKQRKQLIPIVLTPFFLACSGATEMDDGVTLVETNDAVISVADVLLAEWDRDDAPGVVVKVSHNDEVVYSRALGMADLEHGVPLTEDSVFQVASISKQFTAFAILMLVADGQIELDQDIRDFLPELSETQTVVTVQHLLDHTGGLRQHGTLKQMAGWHDSDFHDEAMLLDLVARQNGINFPAGAEAEYSNTGYSLLAEIVARASGQTFQQFMSERVFNPLRMDDSRFLTSASELVLRKAESYLVSGDDIRNVVHSKVVYGSTGLHSSAEDLLIWAENFETRMVGGDEVFELMEKRAFSEDGTPSVFARGQELRPHKGLETWSHGGTDEGFRSFLLRVPESDLEVVVLSNIADFDMAGVAFSLTDIFLADDPNFDSSNDDAWAPSTEDQLVLYEGDYELSFQPGVIYTFKMTEGGLTFAPYGASHEGMTALPETGPREFMWVPSRGLSLVFEDSGDRPPQTAYYKVGQHGRLPLHRVNLEPFDASEVELSDYVGDYFSEELATHYSLRLEDSQLVADHPRLDPFPITPYQSNLFVGAGPLQKMSFTRDPDGSVNGFSVTSSQAEHVRFDRID